MNARQPSLTVAAIKPHKTMLVAKNGMYSCISVLKISPNTKLIVTICAPIPMESQNGPKEERLYACFIS
jgi:hypothetical protein